MPSSCVLCSLLFLFDDLAVGFSFEASDFSDVVLAQATTEKVISKKKIITSLFMKTLSFSLSAIGSRGFLFGFATHLFTDLSGTFFGFTCCFDDAGTFHAI